MTMTANNANAFASTFYFLLTHKPALKNKKSLQATAQDSEVVQCKLDTTTLRTDRRAADNKGLAKVAVQWLIEHLCFVSSAVLADSFVLRNRHLRQAPNRQAVK